MISGDSDRDGCILIIILVFVVELLVEGEWMLVYVYVIDYFDGCVFVDIGLM